MSHFVTNAHNSSKNGDTAVTLQWHCSGQGWQRHLVYKIVIKWSKVEHYLLLFEMMMKLGMLATYCYCWTCSLIIVETFGFSWHWHKCCPKHCNRRYRETLVNYHLWWLPKPKRITEKVSLSLHYEWTKDMVHFGEFLNTWSLWSNSVTRQVSFKRTKIGEKCAPKFKCEILSN